MGALTGALRTVFRVSHLLLSTSTLPGGSFLDYALEPVEQWLDGSRELLFVPYALRDHERYTSAAAAALAPLGVRVLGAHALTDPVGVAQGCGRMFVGGGNTFRLLQMLQLGGLVDAIRSVIRGGGRYLGSSAGTNVACPTIRTTNDMPIVEPASLAALGLVPFQVNPHYLDPIAGLVHAGETRELRLEQYLEENEIPVLGMREGSWLWCGPDQFALEGHTARVFRRDMVPWDAQPGTRFSGDLVPFAATR